MKNLGTCVNHTPLSIFGLIRRKGVYPYDYMDNFDRLE